MTFTHLFFNKYVTVES